MSCLFHFSLANCVGKAEDDPSVWVPKTPVTDSDEASGVWHWSSPAMATATTQGVNPRMEDLPLFDFLSLSLHLFNSL